MATARSASTRAKDDSLVDQDDLDLLDKIMTDTLVWADIRCPVQFSFTRLGAADRHRIPGLLCILLDEMDFTASDLITGILVEGSHNEAGIQDGARWLASVLRGVSEAELRKWIDRGQEYFAAQERAEREEAERQRAEAREFDDRLADGIVDYLARSREAREDTLSLHVGSVYSRIKQVLDRLEDAGKVVRVGEPDGKYYRYRLA
jgi:hypothetical protein